jgi:hypothetical protein
MGRGWIAVVVALASAGCSGGSLSGDVATGEFATTPGSSVLTSAVRTVILTSSGGGFHGSPPAGAACDPSQWSYLLSPEAKRLAFSGCRIQGDARLPESFVPAWDNLPLDDAQLETLTAAVRAVTVSARRECGADADERELRVESAVAALTYGDDFYGCIMDHDHFVAFEGLNNLAQVFAGFDR